MSVELLNLKEFILNVIEGIFKERLWILKLFVFMIIKLLKRANG